MFIYKITNRINNKVYIGQTIRPVEQRFKRHIHDAENNILNTHFSNAIKNMEKKIFYIEILDIAIDQWELDRKEQYWIKYYNSTNSNFGYNESYGIYKCGSNTYVSKTEEEMNIIKEKIRITKLGYKNPNSKAIKCVNKETKEILFFDTVNECRIYFGEKHQTKGLYLGKWEINYA